MPTALLICDDSNMARKQVARSLPDGWDVEITFASNGVEGIAAIKEGKGDVLLLDLNMPEMDGYQVLETILQQDLPTLVIVISGDIQPEAHQRVKSLGALDFIKKPVDKNKLTEILTTYGVFNKNDLIIRQAQAQAQAQASELKSISSVNDDLISVLAPETKVEQAKDKIKLEELDKPEQSTIKIDSDMLDCYQEIANVAMGRAGDLLARLLDVFVVLPIPNVNLKLAN